MEIENKEGAALQCRFGKPAATQAASLARLFIAYTALFAFRNCFMRMCILAEGLSDSEINLIFILISFATVAGLIAIPLLLDKTKLGELLSEKVVLQICAALSAVAAVASYFAPWHIMLSLQFAASFFSFGAIAVCLRRLVGCVSSIRSIGLFIGVSNVIVTVCIIVLFFLPSLIIPPEMTLVILCAFLAVAAFCFEKQSAGSQSDAGDEKEPASAGIEERFTPQILRLSLLLMCINAFVCGLYDCFYFYDDVLSEIPVFFSITFFDVYVLALYIAAGYAVARISTPAVAICGFALYCLGQSMTFFSNADFLAYPYLFFNNTAFVMLEVFTVSLPIVYCVLKGRRTGILPGLGHILLIGGYAVTSILFEFIPESLYTPVLGVMMLLSIAAIIITAYLMNVDKTNRLMLLEAEYGKQFSGNSGDNAGKFSDIRQKLKTAAVTPLTSRELEVAELTVLGIKRKNIADMLFIGSSTVDSHRISIYNKFGVHTREELLQCIGLTGKQVH